MTGSTRCGRPTASTGRPCQRLRVGLHGTPGPACPTHLTDDERAAWQSAQAAAWPTFTLPAAPACWSWPVPDDLDALAQAAVAGLSPNAVAAVLHSDEARDLTALETWHADRCAICGSRSTALVTDHDHETGLVRGLLCRSCNTREGISAGEPFRSYRERHPAAILGVRARYFDPYSGEYATPSMADGSRALLGYLEEGDRWTDNPVVGL